MSSLNTKILNNLQKAAEIRRSYKVNPKLDKTKDILKKYQVDRLRATHDVFLKNNETKDATNFFLTEIYTSKDLTKRDADLKKIVPMMCKLFPESLLKILSDAIELDALTESLDKIMCENLSDNFSNEEYLLVYRTKTSYEDRKRQIELTSKLGNSLKDIVKFPLVGKMLNKMGWVAKGMGLSDMHNLLKNGFNIFSSMKDVDFFLKELINAEYKILNEIFLIKE